MKQVSVFDDAKAETVTEFICLNLYDKGGIVKFSQDGDADAQRAQSSKCLAHQITMNPASITNH